MSTVHSVSAVCVHACVLSCLMMSLQSKITRWPPFWHIQAACRVLHSTAVGWKPCLYIWWFFLYLQGSWRVAQLLHCLRKCFYFSGFANHLRLVLDKIKIASALRYMAAFAPSVRYEVFTAQQVCFCLCKCNTIWGTLTEQHKWINNTQAIWSKHNKGPSCYASALCNVVYLSVCVSDCLWFLLFYTPFLSLPSVSSSLFLYLWASVF